MPTWGASDLPNLGGAVKLLAVPTVSPLLSGATADAADDMSVVMLPVAPLLGLLFIGDGAAGAGIGELAPFDAADFAALVCTFDPVLELVPGLYNSPVSGLRFSVDNCPDSSRTSMPTEFPLASTPFAALDAIVFDLSGLGNLYKPPSSVC